MATCCDNMIHLWMRVARQEKQHGEPRHGGGEGGWVPQARILVNILYEIQEQQGTQGSCFLNQVLDLRPIHGSK